MKVKKLIKEAIEAVEAEIEAVQQKPAEDVLREGVRKATQPPGEHHYEFETHNASIRYAEVIRAEWEDKELEIYPVELDEQKITLNFPKSVGERVESLHVEWENDFVLRCLYDELMVLKNAGKKQRKRIESVFDPANEKDEEAEGEPRHDGRRNEAQLEAVRKAMTNRVLFVWGPPGTGKTATLGYIMANYLAAGKRVLFASNTNRAVDVGLLSAIEALRTIGSNEIEPKTTRYGEPALESSLLEERLFEKHIEKMREERKGRAAEKSSTLEEYQRLQQEVDELMEADEEVPQALDLRCQLLGDKVDEAGGPLAMEEEIDRLLSVNEMAELRKKKLVATTLAKVCTSDLFREMDFDAVVVDEASMANLPYLLVLAGKARKHMVMVGDPMQLPPIALTDQREARDFLERDIFSYVSEAESTGELFEWHDRNRAITCFFDVQYRMRHDLASLISSVFYEGRLKSAGEEDAPEDSGSRHTSVTLFDSSRYRPVLQKKSGDRGFQPLNEVHLQLLERMVKRLVIKNAVPMNEIGIIVPFRSTVYDVRDRLYEMGFGEVEVGTIHTFQGREKRFILFDTVMSGEGAGRGKRHYSVRPFDEAKNGLSVPRLLNVALSRSKDRLVVIADMQHFQRVYGGKFMGRLLEKMRQHSDNG